MAAANMAGTVTRSGGSVFRFLGSFIMRFPRSFFALFFILILTFGAIVDAVEQRDGGVFVTEFVHTFSVDGRIINEVAGMRATAEEHGGTLSLGQLVFPGIRMVGLLYLYWYLFYLVTLGMQWMTSNKSLTGPAVLIVFVVLMWSLQILSYNIVGSSTEADKSVFMQTVPFRGVFSGSIDRFVMGEDPKEGSGLLANYDLWLPSTRGVAGFFVGSGEGEVSLVNTTVDDGVAVDLT